MTENGWHHLVAGPPGGTAAETTADAWVDAASAWFDGHFPGMPVLPGIAQLAMARDAIAAAMGKNIQVSGIRRIRFKRKIGPGERLTVTVCPQRAAGAFAFRILAESEVACTGIMMVAATGPDSAPAT